MKKRLFCAVLLLLMTLGLSGLTALASERTVITRQDIVLVLDPGHGGSDPGAMANDLREDENNLAIALKVRDLMTQWGCQVVMTYSQPFSGSKLTLSDRTALANSIPADLFLSIHTNALDSSTPGYDTASGISTYYYGQTGKGQALAAAVQAGAVSATGAKDRGTYGTNLFVNRETTMDASLIEVGFLTNPQECEKMKTDAYRQLLAEGIAAGLQRYITQVTIPARQAIEDEPDPTPVETGLAYTVTAQQLYCRSGPRTSAPTVTVFLRGDVVTTAGLETADWLYVTDGYVTGWCSKAYLSAGETPPTESPSPTPQGARYTVTASGWLNCRETPSTDSSIVGRFYAGATVTALGEPQNGWLYVTDGTTTGWCSVTYLTPESSNGTPSPSPSPSPEPVEEYVVTASTSLRCRAEPSADAPVVGSFPSGTVVAATGQERNGFLPVSADGISGWCSLTYLKKLTPGGVSFEDVSPADSYYDAVCFVAEQGLFNGTSADPPRFSPNASMTRAMAMTVLHRLSAKGAPFALTCETPMDFADLQPGWYYDAVRWAGGVGLTNGTNAAQGIFSPDQSMTYEQLAVLLYRYAGLTGLDTSPRANLSGYADAGSLSGWATEAVSWAVALKIYPAGTALTPGVPIPRAQVAVMLQGFVEQFG